MQFYQDDRFLYTAVANFTVSGLTSGESVILIATAPHLREIERLLVERGVDLDLAKGNDWYLPADAEHLLPQIMTGQEPDEFAFKQMVQHLFNNVAADRPTRMFGELVALLALDSNYDAAIQLERCWNDLQAEQQFTLFCAYPMQTLSNDVNGEFLSNILSMHTHVVPAEGYSSLETESARAREIIALQQKALWLETEMAARMKLEVRLQDSLDAEREARKQAEQALAQREEFLSVAAHDLRTPITVLSGHTQLLLRQIQRDPDILASRFATILEVLAGQTTSLADLVDQMLDFSRLDSGKLQITTRQCDLAAIARTVTEGISLNEPDREISFNSNGPVMVDADPIRIEQVLDNLLDNAVRYSAATSSIEVAVQTSGHEARLIVRDHGPGIPAEHRDSIFERFFQLDGKSMSAGLGLGLFISRQVMDLHGGTLTAAHPDDGGLEMTATLPLTSPGTE